MGYGEFAAKTAINSMVDQWVIGVLSTSAAFCSQTAKWKWQRIAPILGLVAQPAWYYSTYVHRQWGMFALSFIITGIYLMGIRNFWIVPRSKAL